MPEAAQRVAGRCEATANADRIHPVSRILKRYDVSARYSAEV